MQLAYTFSEIGLIFVTKCFFRALPIFDASDSNLGRISRLNVLHVRKNNQYYASVLTPKTESPAMHLLTLRVIIIPTSFLPLLKHDTIFLTNSGPTILFSEDTMKHLLLIGYLELC